MSKKRRSLFNDADVADPVEPTAAPAAEEPAVEPTAAPAAEEPAGGPQPLEAVTMPPPLDAGAGETLHGTVVDVAAGGAPPPLHEEQFAAAAPDPADVLRTDAPDLRGDRGAPPPPMREKLNLIPEDGVTIASAAQGAPRPEPRSGARPGQVSREDRATMALRYGPMVDQGLTIAAQRVGSPVTPMGIIMANHGQTNAMRARAGLPLLEVMEGVPVDIDVAGIMAGRPIDQAFTRTLAIITEPLRDATGAVLLDAHGRARYRTISTHPGDDVPAVGPGQTVVHVPITTGMAIVYQCAAVPKKYEARVREAFVKHEDTIRSVAALGVLGLHLYAMFAGRAVARAHAEAQAAAPNPAPSPAPETPETR